MIVDTESVRDGQTVSFKHKFLTQPPVTMLDAILQAMYELYQTLKGAIPENSKTRTAVDQLMDIFKNQAKNEEAIGDTQRVLRQQAQAQRLQLEEA